jgi:hypothetical protein
VLLGNGDGTFQTAVTYGSGGVSQSFSIAVAEVNADGKPDLMIANICADSTCSNGNVGVLLGNGDGTFQPAVGYGSGGWEAYSVTTADVNGDGKTDLLVANDGTVGVLLGNGDGTFQTAVTYGSGGYPTLSAVVADVNGDGKPDLLVANECNSGGTCTGGTVGVLINISIKPTATGLVSSLNPSNFGQAVTFTASVTTQGYQGTPTGTVSFFDGTTNIGNSNLNSSGVATFTTSTLAVGTHTMTATYNGDTNFAPSTSAVLQQVVQGAVVALSPPSLNFGNQTVGIPSSPQTETLTNTGNATLNITSISAGANNGSVSATSTCGSSLAPGASCTVSLSWIPGVPGPMSGRLTFTDNAPNSPQTVPLTGVGVLPAVTLSPTSLSFPTQLVFTSSQPQAVTLTNTGAGILTIASVTVSGQFAETNTCGSTVKSGTSCTISVTFRPRTEGTLTGFVSITDNAPGSPQKVKLTGIGTYIELTPTSENFGSQPVGSKSLPKNVTVTNKGSVTVNISAISITGTDPGDFAIGNNTCGTTLASGASCFIKVTFTPLAKGIRTADLSVTDNGGGGPQQVALTGTGT